jgi:hypothetical protein
MVTAKSDNDAASKQAASDTYSLPAGMLRLVCPSNLMTVSVAASIAEPFGDIGLAM